MLHNPKTRVSQTKFFIRLFIFNKLCERNFYIIYLDTMSTAAFVAIAASVATVIIASTACTAEALRLLFQMSFNTIHKFSNKIQLPEIIVHDI